MGISVGDADVVDDEVDSISANGHASANGTSPPDFSGASSPRINGRAELEEPASPRDPVRLLEPGWTEVPSSASLLQPYVDRPWPSRQEAFEHALQLRMSQLTLSEFVEGPESTGDKWVEVFQWFSERRSMVADDRTCILHFIANHPVKLVFGQDERLLTADNLKRISDLHPCSQVAGDRKCDHLPRSPPVQEQPESLLGVSAPPIPIMVTPASPMAHTPAFSQEQLGIDRSAPSHAHESHTSEKTRLSIDTTRNKGKKVREVFISGVHKGRARVTTISKKIGHNVQHVGRHNSMRLKRSNSAPGTASLLTYI